MFQIAQKAELDSPSSNWIEQAYIWQFKVKCKTCLDTRLSFDSVKHKTICYTSTQNIQHIYVRIPFHQLVNLIHCRIQIIKSYFTHEIDCMFDMVHWNCPNKALKTLALKYQNNINHKFHKRPGDTCESHPHRVAKKLLISTGIYRSRAEGIMPFIIIEDIMSHYDIRFFKPMIWHWSTSH